MKKNLFLFAAAVLFTAVSCQEEIASPEIESNAGSALSITASVGADTKTSLGEDGVSSYWAEGDMISVFDSNKGANNRCFEIEEGTEFPAKTATFTYDGEFVMPQNNQPDPLVVALYPYQEAAYCDFFYYDRNYITGLNIPVEQQAVAGAFDSDATFALATGRQSTKEELLFNNLYSLLKVSLVEEGIKKITVTLAEGEYLAGEAKVQLAVDPNDGDPVFTGGVLSASGSNSVSLVCEDGFEVGKNYYIAIAPVTYTSISVALDDKVVKTSTNGKTLNANTIYNLGNLQVPAIETTTFFMRPTSSWENENGRYAAWCWGTGVDDSWYDLTDSDSDGIYELELPIGYENVIILCMKAGTENDWANELARTSDLTLPSDDKNCYNVYTSAWVSVADAKAYDPATIFAEDGFVYFKPNSNWTQANAWFAICLCNGSKGNKWLKLNKIETTSYYGVKLPDDFSVANYKNIIFVRMDSGKDVLDWSSKWNQSGDLDSSEIIEGKNCCSINSGQWDCGSNVTWSTISQLN